MSFGKALVDGDSWTNQSLWPYDTWATLLGFTSQGIGSNLLTETGAYANAGASVVDRILSTTLAGTDTLFVMAGLNDVNNYSTTVGLLPQMQKAAQDIKQYAEMQGVTNRVIFFTAQPFAGSAVWTVPEEAARLAYNSWLKMNCLTFDLDACIGEPYIGPDGGLGVKIKDEYAAPDKAHLSAEGHEVIAEKLRANERGFCIPLNICKSPTVTVNLLIG